ncbi:MAG: sensor histidine kinase, partial [Hyphomicrobium sp.]
MLKTLSLKSRLIAASTAWITFGMIAAWVVLSTIFRTHVTHQFYEELYVHLDELQRLASVEGDRAVMQHNLSDPRYEVGSS